MCLSLLSRAVSSYVHFFLLPSDVLLNFERLTVFVCTHRGAYHSREHSTGTLGRRVWFSARSTTVTSPRKSLAG